MKDWNDYLFDSMPTITEIQKHLSTLKDNEIDIIFLHYKKIIDNIHLQSLGDCLWFFVIKDEKNRRDHK